jgi:flagellar motility protein MotE (MotC chaperone)
MKIALWTAFYVLIFLAMIAAMYFGRDKVLETTRHIPLLNYGRNAPDSSSEESTYYQNVDSLAVVIEGLLGEMAGYVGKVKERDQELNLKDRELNKLKQENDILKKQLDQTADEKVTYSRQQEEKRLQDLASTMSGMKTDVLRPSLTNMDDMVIKVLYSKAKSKDRAKIFNALDPGRAGKIFNEIAKNSNGGG